MIVAKDKNGIYRTISRMYSGGKEVAEYRDNQGRLLFKNWNEIWGSLPLSFYSRGEYLKDYRIYGNTVQNGTPTPDNPVEVKGVGVYDSKLNGYKIPVTVESENIANDNAVDDPDRIPIIVCSINNEISQNLLRSGDIIVVGSDNGYVTRVYLETRNSFNPASIEASGDLYTYTGDGEMSKSKTVRIPNIIGVDLYLIVVYYVNGATPSECTEFSPEDLRNPYIKKVISSNIYIASEPLYSGEYVSYREQKIYKMIDGVLTPVEPPEPFPPIQTIKGRNILTVDTEVQPSEVYIKGKIKSLATHTLTDRNGNILVDKNGYTLMTKE